MQNQQILPSKTPVVLLVVAVFPIRARCASDDAPLLATPRLSHAQKASRTRFVQQPTSPSRGLMALFIQTSKPSRVSCASVPKPDQMFRQVLLPIENPSTEHPTGIRPPNPIISLSCLTLVQYAIVVVGVAGLRMRGGAVGGSSVACLVGAGCARWVLGAGFGGRCLAWGCWLVLSWAFHGLVWGSVCWAGWQEGLRL